MPDIAIEELFPEQNPADMERMVPAFLAIWNARENLRFLSFTGLPFQPAQVRDWFSRQVSAGVRYFCASRPDGHIDGILAIRIDPLLGFELMSIGVAADRQCAGIGRQLLTHGIAVARDAGFAAVDAQVFATNARMLRLLLALGFVPVRMEYHRGSEGEDLVHLKLRS